MDIFKLNVDSQLTHEKLEESIDIVISENLNEICRRKIYMDHDYFKKLIHSKNEQHRQLRWVDLAKSVLGGGTI